MATFAEEPEGTLGIAEVPVVNPTTYDFWIDSARVWQRVLPGSVYEMTDLGYTVVHEVGHWMGLWHVFPSTYREANLGTPKRCIYDDGVDDTPLQYYPTRLSTKAQGCELTKDTCPNSPGRDHVQNYMDYSSDFCMQGFTPGQIARMRSVYQKFRMGL
jgi:hypothetical protein